MGERRGTKGLELWCRRMTAGYPGVKIDNMTTSWRDGLAFCAIIHHFRPDLIDFSKLKKDDIYYNNELAFRTAEHHMGIPALLEPEDMVEFPVPDRLSILTYLSQFYQAFAATQSAGSPARTIPKRPANAADRGIVSPESTSPPTKVRTGVPRREPCAKCGLPVFIAERLNVGKQLYHRTCFRCARCKSQLTLANYYETETANEFCCEICPDEEKAEKSLLNRSLSDEEKSASLQKDEADDYSELFESSLENSNDPKLAKNYTLPKNVEFVAARSFFMNSQIEDSEESSSEDDIPPDLPATKPPDPSSSVSVEYFTPDTISVSSSIVNSSVQTESKDTSPSLESSVNISGKFSDRLETASKTLDLTKETSLVKARMRLFEKIRDPNDCDRKKKSDLEVPSSDTSIEENRSDSVKSSLVLDSNKVLKAEKHNLSEEESNSVIEISSDSNEVLTSEVINISSDIKSEETTTEPNESESVIENKEDTSVIIISDVSSKTEEVEYPEDLNPFGDDQPLKDSPNPFDEEEVPKPAVRKKIKINEKISEIIEDTPEPLKTIHFRRITLNPFGDEDDDEDSPKLKLVRAERFTLNPFWTDGEEPEEEEEKPVALPRQLKSSLNVPEPKPRKSGVNFGSNTSLSSGNSSLMHSGRKKKPAPKPPGIELHDSAHSSVTSSPSTSAQHSPKMTPKLRKNKKAPLPPTTSTLVSSTPKFSAKIENLSPMDDSKSLESDGEDWEKAKTVKDKVNRNRQSQNLALDEDGLPPPDKSTYGKWKRKKGQAPARPIAQRRTIKTIPSVELKQELDLIEIQQQGLEKQGVRLEQIIRERCEGPGAHPDDNLSPDVEDMVLQLFELVNEKNELFRKQAELMYLRRQQRLEEEYADLEYQIRCSMLQPEANKTDSDKAKEEELINRLLEVVERRDEIVQCLEMDRIREAEEDLSINSQMNSYTLKRDENRSLHQQSELSKKEKKKIKKEKKLKQKGVQKVDMDKDIDESEVSPSVDTLKNKKKKKLIFFK